MPSRNSCEREPSSRSRRASADCSWIEANSCLPTAPVMRSDSPFASSASSSSRSRSAARSRPSSSLTVDVSSSLLRMSFSISLSLSGTR